MRLRRRISIAKRGHKLLKDKQDELMRRFLGIIEDTKSLRLEVEEFLKSIFASFIMARMVSPAAFIDKQLTAQDTELELDVAKESFMNLELIHFEVSKTPEYPEYSFFETTSDLDNALIKFRQILPKMVKLAELEIKIKLISEEIKKTRRRVNALEYIFIPNLADTISYINIKLAELERSSLVRLMRVKDILEAA